MNKVKITLSGKEFTIQTDESADYMNRLAESLNRKLQDFMTDNDSASSTTAAMLVALDLMDDCVKAGSDKDNLRKQIIDYLEEATKARAEIMELQKENNDLKKRCQELSERVHATAVKKDE